MEEKSEAKEKVRELWTANPKFPRTKTAKKLGVNLRTLYKWIKGFEANVKPLPQNVERVAKTDRRRPKLKNGGSLDDFRQQFDDSKVVPNMIEAGIKKHLFKDGVPGYMRDQDFREACGVGPGKWRRYADDYKHLQVKKDGITFWGHPEIIDSMRKAVNR